MKGYCGFTGYWQGRVFLYASPIQHRLVALAIQSQRSELVKVLGHLVSDMNPG